MTALAALETPVIDVEKVCQEVQAIEITGAAIEEIRIENEN